MNPFSSLKRHRLWRVTRVALAVLLVVGVIWLCSRQTVLAMASGVMAHLVPLLHDLWWLGWSLATLAVLLLALVGGIFWWRTRGLLADTGQLLEASARLAGGDMGSRVQVASMTVMARVGEMFNGFAEGMVAQQRIRLREQQLREGVATLHRHLGENSDLVPLSAAVISFLTPFLDAILGAFYGVDEAGLLRLLGSYAYHERKTPGNLFTPGEGIVGQVLLEKKYMLLSRVPADYVVAQSGLGQAVPNTLLVFPFLLHGEVKAIVELGTFTTFTEHHLLFLHSVAEGVAMAVTAAQSRAVTATALAQLREQRQTVETTSEALRQSNERLEEQKRALLLSQAQLLEQQEELRVSNEELAAQAQLLEEQKQVADRKNAELVAAQEALRRTAREAIPADPVPTQPDPDRMTAEPVNEGAVARMPRPERARAAPPVRQSPPPEVLPPLQVAFPQRCSQAKPCTLLLVEDDAHARAAMLRLLQGHPVRVVQAATGAAALTSLREQPFDGMIVDLGLPDIDGFDLLDRMTQESTLPRTPSIVYSGRELTREEYERLKQHTNSIVVKGVNAPVRLLSELALLLAQTPPDPTPAPLPDTAHHGHMADLRDKTVLLVDDDVRNVYALTRQLEQKQLKVRMAANGAKALAALDQYPEIACILMDMMMPVMDGLEAIRQLRTQPRWATLPVIALTAKAMEEDRRQALEAGANDYLPKPVDVELLLEKLTQWMSP
ncbi:MAG: response regulator [Magnetococcales bacterium]|nr:response regulator [Magnetococcales bacterium]